MHFKAASRAAPGGDNGLKTEFGLAGIHRAPQRDFGARGIQRIGRLRFFGMCALASPRRMGIAAVGYLLGSAPFAIYVARHPRTDDPVALAVDAELPEASSSV